MDRVKIAFVGAGSFVFGPSMLVHAIPENRMDGIEIALIDPHKEAVELMAAIGRRLAASEGVDAKVSACTDYEKGIAGADFVICSAAAQMNYRFRVDRDIVRDLYPEHLISEFGGVHGASYTMRQIALVRSVAATMKRVAPTAWLFDISNPLPRVCQAAHEDGVKTAGFCSVSVSGYGRLWRLLRGTWDVYPYAESQAALEAKMGGTNHLSWLVALHDRASGEDLMPHLRQIAAKMNKPARSEAFLRRTGYMPMSGDDHIQDFLAPDGTERSLEISSHGDDEAKANRESMLHRVARGDASYRELLDYYSWERPMDVIEALRGGSPTVVGSLNLINEGQIPQLPPTAFVETSCTVDSSGIHPESLNLPESVVPFSLGATAVTEKLVRAAQEKSVRLLEEALEIDPTVLDKAKGLAALRRCLEAHRDLIGDFS